MNTSTRTKTYNWAVRTSGPCPTLKSKTLAQAKQYVEDHAPMKRGWTSEWKTGKSVLGQPYWQYVRYNSNGKLLGSYSVLMYRITTF